MAQIGIADIQALASKRGGSCLSIRYEGMAKKHRWRCGHGHEWDAPPHRIKRGSWCARCQADKQRKTIEEIKAFAVAKGGECLSGSYERNNVKLQFRCADGHVWWATWNDINAGCWCPECYKVNEAFCRRVFEQIFADRFPTKKPAWLHDNGTPLELDGFCEALNIAFEYQGEQHFQASSRFHKIPGDFEQLQRRDRLKVKLAVANNVTLVVINFFRQGPNTAERIEAIRNAIVAAGLSLKNMPIEACQPVAIHSRVGELQALATARGGRCLATVYTGMNSKVLWECSEGHTWEATPKSIAGSWCPTCSGNKRKSVTEMQALAKSRGGSFLSLDYSDYRRKYLWQCAHGHQWEASAASVLDGKWCPECAGNRKKTAADMHALAAARAGRFLSTEYSNNKKRYQWQCSHGHVWEASASSIQSGSWCPQCSHAKKQKRPQGTP